MLPNRGMVDILTAIEEFIEDRESLGRKPATLRFYRTQLSQFAKYVEQDGTTEMEQVGRSEIRSFFAALHRRSTSQGTMAAYDRALRAFLRFCLAEDWLERDPMENRPRLKPPRGMPDTFDQQDVLRLLDVCTNDPVGLRNRAIILLMLDTGLRAGEVVSLTLDRVFTNNNRGKVSISADGSKGVSDRVVPFCSDTLDALQAYLEIRPSEAETVFVTSTGHRDLTTQALTPGGLNQLMRRLCELAGITGKTRLCHIWRHTFAKAYVKHGGDLETLRRMLGHESLDTVRIYLGFATEDIEDLHQKHSPVRQLSQENKKTSF
jgi:site-specific recombinase XerD